LQSAGHRAELAIERFDGRLQRIILLACLIELLLELVAAGLNVD